MLYKQQWFSFGGFGGAIYRPWKCMEKQGCALAAEGLSSVVLPAGFPVETEHFAGGCLGFTTMATPGYGDVPHGATPPS